MKTVVYAVTLLGALVAALGIGAGLLKLGGHGIAVVAAGAVVVVLGASSAFLGRAFPRWAGIVSLVAFLLAALKTRGAGPFQHIMVLAFLGAILSLTLAIVPYRASRG